MQKKVKCYAILLTLLTLFLLGFDKKEVLDYNEKGFTDYEGFDYDKYKKELENIPDEHPEMDRFYNIDSLGNGNNVIDYDNVKNNKDELSIGDYIKFGRYRDIQGKENKVIDKDLYWKVIDKKNGKVFLHLYENISKEKIYNINDGRKEALIQWENNSVRNFLNDEFINNSFTEEEKQCIDETKLENTKDKIFVLNIAEMKKYYPDISKRPYMSLLRDDSLEKYTSKSKYKKRIIYPITAKGGYIDDSFAYNINVCPAMWVDESKLHSLSIDRKKLFEDIVIHNENEYNSIYNKGDDFYYIDNAGVEVKINNNIDMLDVGDVYCFGKDKVEKDSLYYNVVARMENVVLLCSLYEIGLKSGQTLEEDKIIDKICDANELSQIITNNDNKRFYTSDELNIKNFYNYNKYLKRNIDYGVLKKINIYENVDYYTRLCFYVYVGNLQNYIEKNNGWKKLGRNECDNPVDYGLYYFESGKPVTNKIMEYEGKKYYLSDNGKAYDASKVKIINISNNKNKEVEGLYIDNVPYAYQVYKYDGDDYYTDCIGRLHHIAKDIKNASIDDSIEFGNYNGEDIFWRVVEKNGNDVMLMAEKEYVWNDNHTKNDKDYVSYDVSYRRKWLNSDFYNNAFNDSQKSKILKYEVKQSYVFGSGDFTSTKNFDVKDKVFTIVNSKDAPEHKKLSMSVDIFRDKTYKCTYYKRSDAFGLIRPFICINSNIDIRSIASNVFKNNVDDNDNKKNDIEDNSNIESKLYKDIESAKTLYDYRGTTSIDNMDTVILGKYEQDDDPTNGKEDIEWIVVKKENGKALLLSKYVLDVIEEDRKGYYKWEDSNIREWLNGNFYDVAFKGVYDLVDKTKISNECIWHESIYKKYGVKLCWKKDEKFNDTYDNVFLLSIEDCVNVFDACVDNNDNLDVINKSFITDATKYVKNYITKAGKKVVIDNVITTNYILRTSSTLKNSKYFCSLDGNFYCHDFKNDFYFIRPAIWVKYKK